MQREILLVSMLTSSLMAGAYAAKADDSLSIEGYFAATTDYRDRGISLSDRDPTIRGSLSAFHESGFYGGVDAGLVDDGFGADSKTEFFAGYSFDRGGDTVYDLSFELDGFHGGGGSDYYPEIKASMSRDFGLAFVRGGLAYAPEGRWNTPGIDSWYAFTDLEIPLPVISEVTFITRMGYDIREGRSNLFDWATGFSVFMDDFEVTLMFEDSSLDDRRAGGRFVLGTRFYF